MREIIDSTYISLDGVIKDPQAWHFDFWNKESEQLAGELRRSADRQRGAARASCASRASWSVMSRRRGVMDTKW